MPTSYDLTGDLGDLLAAPSIAATAKAWLETNIDGSDALVDTTGQTVRLGGLSVSIAADGTFTTTGLVGSDSTDLNVEAGTLQYQLVVEYRDPGTSSSYKRTWRSGWFSLNATSDIATVAKSVTPAVAQTGADIITAAEAEADRAEAAADLAVAPTDTQVATLAQDPLSETSVALSATIATQIANDSTIYRETLLDSGAVSGALTVDPANGGTQALTLSGDAAIAPTDATPGTTLALVITQGTGAPHAVTWSSKIAWQSEPTLSTTAGLTDVVTLVNVNGFGWLGFVSGTGYRVPALAIEDAFNRADASTLGTTDTGETWTSTGWAIVSNQASAAVGGITTRAIVDAGSSDVRVSCLPTNTSHSIRLEARTAQDDSTYYRLVWSSLTATNSYIQRNDGSGFAVFGDYFSLNAVVGDRIGFSVTEDAGVVTITAYRNDTEIYSITDPTPIPAATYAGMIAITAAVVDDFRVDFL